MSDTNQVVTPRPNAFSAAFTGCFEGAVPRPGLSDDEIIEKAGRYLDKLVRAGGRSVRSLFGFRLPWHDVEEAKQEALIRLSRLLSKSERGKPLERRDGAAIENPIGYLFGVFRLCLRHKTHVRGRRAKGARSLDALANDDGELAISRAEALEPSEELERRELVQAVGDAVASLPEPFAEATRLAELEGLTHVEVAERLDVRKGTVDSRCFRARKLLQPKLRAWIVAALVAGALLAAGWWHAKSSIQTMPNECLNAPSAVP